MPTWKINADGLTTYAVENKRYAENNPVWFIEVRHRHYFNGLVDAWFYRPFGGCSCQSRAENPTPLYCIAGNRDECGSTLPCSNDICRPVFLSDPKGLNEEYNGEVEKLLKKLDKK